MSLDVSDFLRYANLLIESQHHAPAAAYVVTILHPYNNNWSQVKIPATLVTSMNQMPWIWLGVGGDIIFTL